jgi:trehalose/maltose transport system permease protein
MTTAAQTETTRTYARPASGLRRLRKTWWGRFLIRLPFYLLIAMIFIYALFPFYWAVRSSFTPEGDLFSTPLQYFPSHPTLENYRQALDTDFFRRALLNSTIVAGSVTLLSLAIGSLAAYALGRFRFRGRSFVLYLMLSMTIFPQIAILGALYTMVNGFDIVWFIHFPKLYDTLGALVFTYLIFTLPFTVWVLTSFMRALPGELEEAAYVDGATPLQVFWKVLLPLIAPGLVTTGLLAFIAAWNEYLYALSFIQTPQKYTVPIAITSFVGKSGAAFNIPWGQIMAATVIVTLPLIAATLILQRRILAGLTAGAVKG